MAVFNGTAVKNSGGNTGSIHAETWVSYPNSTHARVRIRVWWSSTYSASSSSNSRSFSGTYFPGASGSVGISHGGSGGWLKPGHMAYNAGTKPEAVLNPRESAAYVQRGASGAGMSEGDLRALRDLLMEAMDAHPATRIAESLGDAVSTSGRRRASMRGA